MTIQGQSAGAIDSALRVSVAGSNAMAIEDRGSHSEAFRSNGFVGPIRLFTSAECADLAGYLSSGRVPLPADWYKGRAVTDRILYDCSTRPPLLQLLSTLLGDDLVLWGVDVVVRTPRQVHHWHTDIESSDPQGGFVSVWVGLENTSRESTIQMVSGSHRYGKSIQQVYRDEGQKRGDASAEEILGWAQRKLPECGLVQPDCSNGEALLFDGRLWHGSLNGRNEGTRTALLMQFASADRSVFIPDLAAREWPFRLTSVPRPPVILVQGEADKGVNRLVPPPPIMKGVGPLLSSVIRTHPLPMQENKRRGWKPCRLFQGSTRIVDDLACHASVLSPGHSPHPPHTHVEEELLILIDGEAELVIPRAKDDPDPRIETLKPGMFAYYPAFQHHTIRNRSHRPATYLMLKWTGDRTNAEPLASAIFTPGAPSAEPSGKFGWKLIFESPTTCLGQLHAHSTRLQPGTGYEAHADPYDVAIVLLSGQVRSLGEVVGPLAVLFFAAGEPHDMRNVGVEAAHYLVFEFHGPGVIRKKSGRRGLPLSSVTGAATASALPGAGADAFHSPGSHGAQKIKAKKRRLFSKLGKVLTRLARRIRPGASARF